MKATVAESLFNKVARSNLQLYLKKKPRQCCFPVNFEIYLGTATL